jgi:hypothetical protein
MVGSLFNWGSPWRPIALARSSDRGKHLGSRLLCSWAGIEPLHLEVVSTYTREQALAAAGRPP